ncbi:hypothetical protein OCAR_4933 [Afipia carboxidovorans OM5]|nr:hypothetical protein OCAR_4933 [Afipia carboxidovorans OM5]
MRKFSAARNFSYSPSIYAEPSCNVVLAVTSRNHSFRDRGILVV